MSTMPESASRTRPSVLRRARSGARMFRVPTGNMQRNKISTHGSSCNCSGTLCTPSNVKGKGPCQCKDQMTPPPQIVALREARQLPNSRAPISPTHLHEHKIGGTSTFVPGGLSDASSFHPMQGSASQVHPFCQLHPKCTGTALSGSPREPRLMFTYSR
eukprot:scaffold97983_cov19-Tisochrysis_lutea.AAC.1